MQPHTAIMSSEDSIPQHTRGPACLSIGRQIGVGAFGSVFQGKSYTTSLNLGTFMCNLSELYHLILHDVCFLRTNIYAGLGHRYSIALSCRYVLWYDTAEYGLSNNTLIHFRGLVWYPRDALITPLIPLAYHTRRVDLAGLSSLVIGHILNKARGCIQQGMNFTTHCVLKQIQIRWTITHM